MRLMLTVPVRSLGFLIGAALAAGAQGADLHWFGNGTALGGTGTWSNAGTNWDATTTGPASIAWTPDSTAIFDSPSGTVTVDIGGITVGNGSSITTGIKFQTSSYTLIGGTVTLAGPYSAANPITVNTLAAETATISSVIAGSNGLTKLGPGTLQLGAANSYTGETVIEGGALTVTGSINPSEKIYVGYSNPDAHLLITNGGSATVTNGYLGVTSTSSNNTAMVSDALSLWTNSLDLTIGYASSFNALTVKDQGAVSTKVGYIGWGSNAGSNSVLVTGSGSTWSNSDVLYIGFDGSNNSFSVESGGGASSTKDTVIGFNSNSASNSLKVKDSGSKLEITGGNTLIVGDKGSSNTLEISNGGLVTGNKNVRLGYHDTNSASNLITVTGLGSRLNFTGSIRVGEKGHDNTVTVSAGASAFFGGVAFIGYGDAGLNTNASNNTVTVTGSDSTWESGDLTVGKYSLGNVLNIAEAGSVTTPHVFIAVEANSGGAVNIGTGGAAGMLTGSISFGAGAGTLNFNHTNPSYLFNNLITGTGTVRFIGGGTTLLSAANTYTGNTELKAGTLRLGVDNAVPSTSSLAFNGGVLETDDRSVAIGALSLQANSTLRFGNATARQDTVFASAASYVGGTLTIDGWDGASGSTYDRLIITADPAASGILNHIQFSGYPIGANWIASTGEVVPVPGCGSANGTITPTPPTTNLCTTGTASSVTTTNGLYTWSCAGNGAASIALCSASSSSGGGLGHIELTTTGSGCTVQSANLQSPPNGGPAGITMPYNTVNFILTGCSGNPATATLHLTYPGSVAGMQYWKYIGGQWIGMPATLSGNTVTFTIQDNGPYDADNRLGFIADPSGPGLSNGRGASNAIPTLSEWGMILFSALMLGLIGWQQQRRA